MTFIWLLLAMHPNPDIHMPLIAFKELPKCEALAESLRKRGFEASCDRVEIR